jgi:putative ABC transport system ATP-binding protein
MSEAAIRLRGVEFAWPRGPRVLSIAALEVARGERVMLRGASGSGKSTLLGVIGGVLVPQAGSVEILGTDLTCLPGAARDRFRGQHFGFIFQMFNLIPYLSVIDNVLLPLRLSPARAARVEGDPHAAAEALLAALGLGDAALQGRAVTALSIGQQQRVAAARALIGRPEIIVADEPTSSLDADAREGFLALLMQECRAAGATLLFVSHDASLAGHFDRAVAMDALNAAERLAYTPSASAATA